MGLKDLWGVLLLCLAWKPEGIASDPMARVQTTLSVTNGGSLGVWSSPQLCPEGTFAVGFSLKVEGNQLLADDTAMNGVTIVCADRSGQNDDGGFQVTSGQGSWGTWKEVERCSGADTQLVSFSLKVLPPVGTWDDTAATWIKFNCRQGDNSPTVLEIPIKWWWSPWDPFWGTYGDWSAACPSGQAICGMRTRIEPDQLENDDTALNDVEFYCCSLIATIF